jgi:hypothetical protein
VLALALASCGGSNKQQASYVSRANAICRQALAELHKTPEPTTPAQAISFLPRAITIIEHQVAGLDALDVPASQRGHLQAALGSVRSLGTVLGGFVHQLRAGTVELSTFEQVQTQSTTLRAQINRQFRQAGLSGCVDSQA